MKKIIVIIITATATILFSCKKGSNNNSAPVCAMCADINGMAFNGTNCIVHFYDSTTLEIIGGFFPDSVTKFPYIQLFIVGYAGVGNYILLPPNLKYYGSTAEIDSAASNTINFYSGAISITSVSPTIAGTFSFTTTSGSAVTHGSFSSKGYF